VRDELYLVRYGVVPEVARFRGAAESTYNRGEAVVVETHRGRQSGTVLERVRTSKEADTDFHIVGAMTDDDRAVVQRHRQQTAAAFAQWQIRIAAWKLSLELVDLEWTLDDGKQILYVLTERGPETTQLALQAAAAGLGLIEVQPVTADGLASVDTGGGCGTGGCGCSH
jgi:cell fate regulator YaaT (PSP1 superfamily)